MSSEVSSLFAKKKGKKGKKKSTTLNLDPTAPKTEEKPKIAQLQEILGGPNPSEDDGWAEVVEKKSVVATGGKQVSDLIDMTSLMEDDETTASKLEKQDIKQAFHHARTMKEAKKKENAPDAPKKEDAEKVSEAAVTKPKGLSGNIFGGGGAAGRGGPGAGWQARMAERELKQREQQLSVDNSSAFPSLADAMSGPPKPKQGGAAVELNPWVRRGGGSAAAAAIKAALGRRGDGESKTGGTVGSVPAASGAAAAAVEATPPAPKPQPAAPMWVAPQRSGKIGAEEAGNASAVVADGDAATSATDDSATKGHEDAPASSSAPAPVAEPVIDMAEPAPSQEAQAETKAGNENVAKEGEQSAGDSKVDTAAAPALEAASNPPAPPAADKEALVQQFGKKKKKKKKPVDGDT